MTAADSIADWIVSQLSAAQSLSGTPVIRQTDETFDRAQSVVVVDVQDMGDHDGIPGHVLVDAKAAVGVWVHTTDDPALAQTSELRAAVRAVLDALPQGDAEPIGDWYVRYVSGWAESAATLEGNDRKVEFSANLILQSTSI